LTHDSRENKFNPAEGDHIQLKWNDFPEWFNNNSDFSFLDLEANLYDKLNAEKIMAYRLTGYYAYGDVPFVGELFVGNNDIRGYTTGEYRG
jgi:hypothetical protein